MDQVTFGAFFAAGVGALLSNLGAEWVKTIVRRGQTQELIRDAELQKIQSEIEQIRILSERFWGSNAATLGDERSLMISKLVAALHTISETYASLLSGPSKHDCDMSFMKAHEAITGGDFDAPDRAANYQRLTKIFVSLTNLDRTATNGRRALKRQWLA